jgi:hypothetical protein
MLKKKKGNNFLLLLPASFFFVSALFLHSKSKFPNINISKENTAININREFIRIFSFGHKKLISSIYWILTLLESDEEKIKNSQNHSWMYHRFKTISSLDPRFYQNYLYGGIYLSVIKDDLEGAAKIFDLGLEQYPDDYYLNYQSGFNLYFEMDDLKGGLIRLQKIQHHPRAPERIKFLVSKLQFETTKNYDSTLEFLMHNLSITQDKNLKEKIRSDIYAVKAERDLKCLSSKNTDCDRRDAEGDLYIFHNGQWKSQKEFLPYKIFKKIKKP